MHSVKGKKVRNQNKSNHQAGITTTAYDEAEKQKMLFPAFHSSPWNGPLRTSGGSPETWGPTAAGGTKQKALVILWTRIQERSEYRTKSEKALNTESDWEKHL